MKKGFTFIELIVIVLIIAIIAAVIYPILGHQVRKAKDAKAIIAIGAVRTNIMQATGGLQGYAPIISGGATGTLYTLVNGGTLYANSGSNVTASGASTLIKGIDPNSAELFSNYSTSGAQATIEAGSPSKVKVSYSLITPNSATVTFDAEQKNSSNKYWNAL